MRLFLRPGQQADYDNEPHIQDSDRIRQPRQQTALTCARLISFGPAIASQILLKCKMAVAHATSVLPSKNALRRGSMRSPTWRAQRARTCVCMCVCMYIYICVCMCVYVCICVCVFVFV
jgi:hypothetical protein